jgi:hypothetical protein
MSPARSGPGSDSRDGAAGRQVPFGPEISWPYGFRQMDPESRDLIESAYRPGPGYQQPAMDDYGYGDPGYSDPSYEGPKAPYNSPAFPGQGGGATNPPAPRPYAGSGYYPEQWYDHPRLDDRVANDMRRGAADPRLEGITYGELRYDDPDPRDQGGPAAGGPPRRPEPQGPALGRRPGPSFTPAPGRPAGYGQPGSYGQPRGPQMNAGRRTGPEAGQPGSPSAAGDSAGRDTGFLAAPVGLLTPPDGTRMDALRDDDATSSLLTAPDVGRRGHPGPVRPGHGLDGPEITSSWPVQPSAEDLGSFDDFWREDADEEYSGLFGDRGAEFDRADAKQASKKAAAKRSTGRRRGRSSDHRLWLGLGGVVVVAAAAIVGIVKFEFPSHGGGPAHTMSAPASIGTYERTVGMERSTDLAALQNEVIKMSSGEATDVQSAVYKSGNSAAGNTEQIVMFIGGHLANADPAASIASFTQKFPGAQVAGAGALGGKAACVQEGTAANAVAMCAWFDNDSFGEIVSPTMNATALAQAMQAVRPAVEHLAPK